MSSSDSCSTRSTGRWPNLTRRSAPRRQSRSRSKTWSAGTSAAVWRRRRRTRSARKPRRRRGATWQERSRSTARPTENEPSACQFVRARGEAVNVWTRTGRRLVMAAATAVCLAAPDASAQYFGRNKVQYKNLDFQVLKTEHFDIYFYPSARESVDIAARMAERWHARLQK